MMNRASASPHETPSRPRIVTSTTQTTSSVRKRAGLVRDFASISKSTQAGKSTKVESLSSASPANSLRELSIRSISTRSSSDNQSGEDEHERSNPVQKLKIMSPSKGASKALAPRVVSFKEEIPQDLQEIKASVDRLRAQRTHVEQLRQHNERLERLLSERSNDNEKLRREVVTLHGVEQENVGLLQTFKLLEERIRNLEATCSDRKEEARIANERVVLVENERDQLQLQVDEFVVKSEKWQMHVNAKAATHEQAIEKLEKKHERELEMYRRMEREYLSRRDEMKTTLRDLETKHEEELETVRNDNKKLENDVKDLEQQVQQLLATTVRQTTMIEDFDRALSEAKSRHESAKTSYQDQLQLNAKLKTQVQELETKVTTAEHTSEVSKRILEKRILDLETKVSKFKDKNDLYRVALQEKENQLERVQQVLLVRDRSRFHVEEVAKELKKKEKVLLSELSELEVALADARDENAISQDQVHNLQEQLENERKDRSRWATARLKLLAEFCDEENKLNSALHQYSTFEMLHSETMEDEDDDDDLVAEAAKVGHMRPPQSTKSQTTSSNSPIVFG
ncbi:hypothetical protein Poli38472_005410 [Pythium oligandrum]|uniref:Uncharacterized protein n=1 Tax=Pythium oligandrum TaxID=41045 RepID=A0A8K1FKG2_PYTOL|nr:hypothetical protein Poli38472_005410 [Pythium oligandrum]|eukprot:TMW62792.1 hypothetical protein Poli38472_005410 [Pythium oligandrum]